MNNREKLQNLFVEHEGRLTTEDVVKAGIPTITLTRLVRSGIIESPERGIYIDANTFDDEMWTLQKKYPSIVFSHETALWIHGLSDRTPLHYSVTVPYNFYTVKLHQKQIKTYFVKPINIDIGLMINSKSPMGNSIRLYNVERTIIDMYRNRSRIDGSIITQAIQSYVKRKDKDLLMLHEYANIFRVTKLIHPVLEVLL